MSDKYDWKKEDMEIMNRFLDENSFGYTEILYEYGNHTDFWMCQWCGIVYDSEDEVAECDHEDEDNEDNNL